MVEVAKYEEDLIPTEKWLVSLRKDGKPFIRQFRAEGYYEAYDTVLTHIEKHRLEVLWFKEKRDCDHRYMNKNYPDLESVCVYCIAIFNETEPIPCYDENCNTKFCSKTCMKEHYKFRHKK